jgi:polysaccharide transporter, PST family
MSNQVALIMQYGANALVPLVLAPHVVRTIGMGEFGLLSMMLSIGSMAAIIVNYGYPMSAVPLIVQAKDNVQKYNQAMNIIFTKLCLFLVVTVLMLVGIIIAKTFFGYSLQTAHAIMLFALPVAAALNMSWYLQATGRFRAITIASLVACLIAVSFGYFFVRTDSDTVIVYAAISFALAPIITGLVTLALGVSLKLVKRRHFSLANIRVELKRENSLFVSFAIAAVYGSSGVLLVGAFAGTYQAGLYSAAERIANAGSAICLLSHTAAYPKLAELYFADRRGYLKLLAVALVGYFLTALFIIGVIVMFWPLTLVYFFGSADQNTHWMLFAALALVLTMISGNAYVGYLTVSGQSQQVLPLTTKILLLVFLIGVPMTLIFGGKGWLFAITLTQFTLGLLAIKKWYAEYKDVSSSKTQVYAKT